MEDLEALQDLGQKFAALAMATVDELTGLSNRCGFLSIASHSLALCHRDHRAAMLLYFDLDGFKQINDSLGHAMGDAAIRDFAEILLESFRDSDVVARLGRDEFCALLTGADEQGIAAPVRRLEAAVAARNAEPGRAYRLAYSMGAVVYSRREHHSIADLLADADRCMYEQKRSKAEVAR